MTTPLKILFIAANPEDTYRLAQDEEYRRIEEGLRSAGANQPVQLIPAWAARPQDVQPSILRDRPHIVHVSGHGTGAGVALTGPKRRTAPASAAAWRGLFASLGPDEVRLVVLSWCESAGLANELSASVDFTAGFPGEPRDSLAATFAVGLYCAIAAGRSMRQSFDLGVNSIDWLHSDAGEEERPELFWRDGIDPSAIRLPAVAVFTPVPLSPEEMDETAKVELIKKMPLGPALPASFLDPKIRAACSELYMYGDATDKLDQARRLRRLADPDGPEEMVIRDGELLHSHKVEPKEYWDHLFPRARLKGPRMLGALLLAIDSTLMKADVRRAIVDVLSALLRLSKGNDSASRTRPN